MVGLFPALNSSMTALSSMVSTEHRWAIPSWSLLKSNSSVMCPSWSMIAALHLSFPTSIPTYILLHFTSFFLCSQHRAALTHPGVMPNSLAVQDSPSHTHGRLDHRRLRLASPASMEGVFHKVILIIKSSTAQSHRNGSGRPLYPRLSSLGCVTSFLFRGDVAASAVQLRQL